MNFIDKAIANKENMSADDFLQAMADIYSEPGVWNILNNYPQYIQDIVYIIDYDTEIQMEGLESFVVYNKEQHEKTITAMLNAGITQEAELLNKAIKLDFESDYEDELEAISERIALYNDYDGFWDLVRKYIEKNK